MKKYFSIIVSALVIITSLQSCSSKGNSEPATKTEEAPHEDEHENPNTATLTEAQMKAIGVELGTIEQKELTSALKANGVLKVPNQNKASINSVYNGVVRSLLIQPGNTVKKGQVIATVSNPEFIQVQDEYLNVNSRIVLAEQEYTRQKELNAGNAGALKNLQSAETELKTLRSRKSSLQLQVQLMGINPASISSGKLATVLSIRSPISGIVSNVMVTIGTYVDANTPVAEIVNNKELHLDLYVYEKDIPKLRNDQLIHFTLTNNQVKEYEAQIFSLGSSFEGESKAVTVHAKVQGDITGLIEGMSVTAAISLEKATSPAVPTDAIVTVQGQDHIFILSDEHAETEHHEEGKDSAKHDAEESHDHKEEGNHKDEKGLTFEKIPVAKGTSEVGYTQITLLKEIPKDAKVVVKGAFFVLAKMTNTGEHEH